MKLLVTTASPYARKVRAAVIELGIEDEVEEVILPIRLPKDSKPDVEAVNPLGKIPALVLDNGRTIVDSPVILAYLNEHAHGELLPSASDVWEVLTLEALADGCMDAGFVLRMEQLKDEARRDPAEVAAYTAKINRTLDLIERDSRWLGEGFDAGRLALACAIDWMIFRDLVPGPLAARPRLAAKMSEWRERPSLRRTAPSV